MQPLLIAFDSHWEPLVWFALGMLGAVGLVAVLDPRRIATVALGEQHSVETVKGAASIEGPAGNRFAALAVCRLVGVAVLASVAGLAYLLAQR